MWACVHCGKQVEKVEVVKCPYCGYRILQKVRPPVVKKVKAA